MKGVKAAGQASPELLAYLPAIAEQLVNYRSTVHRDGNEPWLHMRTSKDRTVICLDNVPRRFVRELGAILLRLGGGENAHTLFRQNERRKPTKTSTQRAVALAYYSMRAIDPAGSESPALRKVRSLFPEYAHSSDATLRKYAQRNRKRALGVLRLNGRFVLLNGKVIPGRTKAQIDALEKHIHDKVAGRVPG
jgi:hypothetical protein